MSRHIQLHVRVRVALVFQLKNEGAETEDSEAKDVEATAEGVQAKKSVKAKAHNAEAETKGDGAKPEGAEAKPEPSVVAEAELQALVNLLNNPVCQLLPYQVHHLCVYVICMEPFYPFTC